MTKDAPPKGWYHCYVAVGQIFIMNTLSSFD